MDEFIAANRRNWDSRAELHSTDQTFYRIDEVLAGADSLTAVERAEIGDVSGKRLVHLQCHIGLDTISLARRGAVATGLDFSPKAIAVAQDFAARAGVPARFVQADVHEAPAALGGRFEIVFVTWGTVTWLPDIFRWAEVVAEVLEPGGFLYFADLHPSATLLEEIDGKLVPHYGWRTPKELPLVFDDVKTYTGDARELDAKRCYNWIHPLSDILTALCQAGLVLDWLHEHEVMPAPLFPMMVKADSPGLYRLPDGQPRMPLSFSLKATKA